jgi:hypothetical protein
MAPNTRTLLSATGVVLALIVLGNLLSTGKSASSVVSGPRRASREYRTRKVIKGAVTVRFESTSAIRALWQSKSSGERWEATNFNFTTAEMETVIFPGRMSYYGERSGPNGYQRSMRIQLADEVVLEKGGVPLLDFLLISIADDPYRISYRAVIPLLQQLGLFYSYSKLVEVSCRGVGDRCKADSSLGVYLLIEYPRVAIERVVSQNLTLAFSAQSCDSKAMIEARRQAAGSAMVVNGSTSTKVYVGHRRRGSRASPFRFSITDMGKRNQESILTPFFDASEKNLTGAIPFYEGGGSCPLFVDPLATGPAPDMELDLSKYLQWLAVASVLQRSTTNGESIVFSRGKYLGVMGWGFNRLFRPCKVGFLASSRNPLDPIYCPDGKLDDKILKIDALKEQYARAIHCVTENVLTQAAFTKSLTASANELSRLYRISENVVDATCRTNRTTFCTFPGRSIGELQRSFRMSRETIVRAANRIVGESPFAKYGPGQDGEEDEPALDGTQSRKKKRKNAKSQPLTPAPTKDTDA